MKKEVLKEPIFTEKIVEIIQTAQSSDEIREKLTDYHDNDIAQSFELLSQEERKLLYSALGIKWMAEIIPYVDDIDQYIEEIGMDQLANMINEMDADDAVNLGKS